jgi:hypothetical protein
MPIVTRIECGGSYARLHVRHFERRRRWKHVQVERTAREPPPFRQAFRPSSQAGRPVSRFCRATPASQRGILSTEPEIPIFRKRFRFQLYDNKYFLIFWNKYSDFCESRANPTPQATIASIVARQAGLTGQDYEGGGARLVDRPAAAAATGLRADRYPSLRMPGRRKRRSRQCRPFREPSARPASMSPAILRR